MAVTLLRSGFTFFYLRIDRIVSLLYAYDAQSDRWNQLRKHPVWVAAEVNATSDTVFQNRPIDLSHRRIGDHGPCADRHSDPESP